LIIFILKIIEHKLRILYITNQSKSFNFEIKNNPNYKIVVCKKFVKLCKIFMLKATEFVFGYNS